MIEDGSNRQRLAKLLRFTTSKSPKKLTGLEEYVERMKTTQKKIYFIIGMLAIFCCKSKPYQTLQAAF